MFTTQAKKHKVSIKKAGIWLWVNSINSSFFKHLKWHFCSYLTSRMALFYPSSEVIFFSLFCYFDNPYQFFFSCSGILDQFFLQNSEILGELFGERIQNSGELLGEIVFELLKVLENFSVISSFNFLKNCERFCTLLSIKKRHDSYFRLQCRTKSHFWKILIIWLNKLTLHLSDAICQWLDCT